MELLNNQYVIDDVPIEDIIRKYDTPLYVYETAKMEKQYNQLVKAFKGTRIKIYYACKALTNLNIMKFFKGLGAGLDAVSIQEVMLGIQAGYAPEDIIYTPNCVSLEEINQAVEIGVRINIDNISILEQFGHDHGDNVPVWIRINPHIMAGGNQKISTGHID